MRTAGTVLLLFATLLVAGPAEASDRTCQQVVARVGGKLVKTGLKAYQRCALRSMRRSLPAADCRPRGGARTGDPGTDATIAGAVGRLTARLGRACAGADLSRYAARCGAPAGAAFSVASLIDCLRTTHLERASAMTAIELPASPPALPSGGVCGDGMTCTCRCAASPSGAFIDGGGTGSR